MWLKGKVAQTWARRLHIYISMALLTIVLFFSITGITLNRPELFEASEPTVSHSKLELPTSTFHFAGQSLQLDRTALIRFLKQQTDVSGNASPIEVYTEIENNQWFVAEATFDFKGPGKNSTVFIDVLTKTIEVETTHYGTVALLNDLHKGRNTGEAWKWFIDITAALMILFVITGVCLLLPKKKTLAIATKWASLGTIVSLALYLIAVP